MPVFMYGSKRMIWKEKGRCRIRSEAVSSLEYTNKEVVWGDEREEAWQENTQK